MKIKPCPFCGSACTVYSELIVKIEERIKRIEDMIEEFPRHDNDAWLSRIDELNWVKTQLTEN